MRTQDTQHVRFVARAFANTHVTLASAFAGHSHALHRTLA
ncbi:MAG: hypothetical protein ACI89X_003334 [Planctomycetota bacterium]